MRRSRSGSAKASAARTAAASRSRSATRSWPTATAWMTYGAASVPPSVTTAVARLDRALLDGGALDRVAAVALDRGCGAGGHEERLARRDDERIHLQLRDVPLPDVDLDRSCHDVPSFRRLRQSAPRWSRGSRPRSAVVTS